MLGSALAALACTSSTAPNGTVTARATSVGILATNRTTRPVFFVAVERNGLALYDFAPCTDASRCDTIAPGARRTIGWSDVALYSPSAREFVLLWWQAPAEGATPLMRSVVVTR